MRKQILLLLIIISLFSLPGILAIGGCKVTGDVLVLNNNQNKFCKDADLCVDINGDSKLSFEGVESFNVKKGSTIKCSSNGELLPGTDIEFGTKGFSSSYPVKIEKNGIILDGVAPGDMLKVLESREITFIKHQNNIKDIGEGGRKEFQITSVTVCDQKFDAPVGEKSHFIISKEGCRILQYKIRGQEIAKEIQTSSYKCGSNNLKLNGVAVGKGFSFSCDNEKGNIECSVPGCFENIAGYYNLDIDGVKFQNLKGFISYKYENTGIYKIEGNDVIADFKGANVHCNTDECYFFKGSLVYKPKSGLGIRKTGGLEIGLPGLKMFEIKPQVSDPAKISQTGCFIVLEKGELLPLERDDVYKEIGCIRPTKVNILPGIDLDREFSGNIKITPYKGAGINYDIEEKKIGIQEKITKLKEEPAPEVRIAPKIQEITVKLGCTPPTTQYYLSENNLPVCLTEEEAKEAFKLSVDKLPKSTKDSKECQSHQLKYNLPFEDPSFVCLTEDQAREFFAAVIKDLPKEDIRPDIFAVKPTCPDLFEYDIEEGCISEKKAEAKQKLRDEKEKKGRENEILEEFKDRREIKKIEGQSCNPGSDRCSFDFDVFSNKILYFKERCIYHKDIKIPTLNFLDGYYKNEGCTEKIKPEPGVTVINDNEVARERLRGQSRKIRIEDPVTDESIRFGRQVAPDLIKNKNRAAVTLKGYVDELASEEGNLGDIISAVADENNIDRAIVKSIISKESSFRINAVSPVGAAGLMQLMPYTAKSLGLQNIYRGDEFTAMYNNLRFGRITSNAFMAFQKEYAEDLKKQIAGKSQEELALFDDRFDPEKNLNAGVSYFARAYEYNKKDLGLALVTYNAGLGYVEKNCKGTYSSCNFGTNKETPAYVSSITQLVTSGGPVLDTREKILAFVNSVPREKLLNDLIALNKGDKKKAFEDLGRMDIEPSFVQFNAYLKNAQLDLYQDPEKQGISKSFIVQGPQFIPQGVKITADLPTEKILGIFGGSYIIERSSGALPLWRLKDSKGSVVSGLDNKELFEIFTSRQFARGSINLPFGNEIRRFSIESDPKTKVRYFIDQKTKEELQPYQMAEKIQKAAVQQK